MPAKPLRLFLCGDIMTGRGIDQILPHPSAPHLYEPYMKSAVGYVELAERAAGALVKPVAFAYVWGEALTVLGQVRPDARIVNLETAVTTSEEAWPDKGIHYRMHPDNVPCLTAAHLDCCVLANNHVLDWGRSGLDETLESLRGADLHTAGAGRNAEEALAPAVIQVPGAGRVLVYACAMASSGVIPAWSATSRRSGVAFLPDLTPPSIAAISRRVRGVKQPRDFVVFSIHWGGNWGYAIEPEERAFAHALIDEAGVDLVHGHSSHHVKGVEIYRDHAILYGCGDFLNDYEGIAGYESYRPDLSLMYFPLLDARRGTLIEFCAVPMQIGRLRVNRAAQEGAQWLFERLARESGKLGTRVELERDGTLRLRAG